MFDWENLRHFLALGQTGTLSGAARALKVDHATVSRRVAAFEAELDAQLVDRLPRSWRLTAMGKQVFDLALQIEAHAFAVERAARVGLSPLVGKVTISAPPVLAGNFFSKRLFAFRKSYPDIQLSISSQSQKVSLARREADIAVRLSRPEERSNVARRLGNMPFALYASRDYAHIRDPSNWEFIAYNEQFSEMPHPIWLNTVAGTRPIVCEVSDIDSQHAAACTGIGVAGLPCFLGDADPTLERLPYDGEGFSREIWMVVHRDIKRSPPVRAVMDLIAQTMRDSTLFQR